ncbi:hypothetical protein CHISP_0320 [Chitinispirillum alkaliphilum]|nr:hypothetical protein CHISP_0320 [Chitinispirillum alkaliphilum]
MSKSIFYMGIALVVIGLMMVFGCTDSSVTGPGTQNVDYPLDTIDVDYTGANNVVFYHFATGTKTSLPRTVWHLGFDKDFNIVTNSGHYGSGVHVHKTNETDFGTDFSDLEDVSFVPTYSDNNPIGSSWMDLSSMPPSYTNTIYLVKTHDNSVYKVQFTGATMAGGVRMKIGTPSQDDAEELTFGPVGDYDMVYINLATKSAVDFAPPKDQWDLRFGRTEFAMGTMTGGRSSIVLNTAGGVEAAVLEDVSIDNVENISALNFSNELFTIGYEWYAFDQASRIFSLLNNTYVVRTVTGNYAKFQIGTFYSIDDDPRKQFWSIFEYLYQADGATTFSK